MRLIKGTRLTEADRTHRILLRWPEFLLALTALGALYPFWRLLFV